MSSGQGVPTAVAGAKVAALNMSSSSSSSSSSVAADASAAAAATSASSASGSAEGVASTSEGSSAVEVPSPSAASGKKRKKKTKGKGKSKRRRLAELAKKGRENEVFNNLKESNEKEAKHIVSVVFPSKVLSLTQHIEQSAEYNVADLSEIDADLSMCLPGDSEKAEGDEKAKASSSSSSSSSVKPDTSAYKLRNPFGDAPVPDAKVPCNEKVVSMMKWLRKEVRVHFFSLTDRLSVSLSVSLSLCLSVCPEFRQSTHSVLALPPFAPTARRSIIHARQGEALDPTHGATNGGR